MQDNPLNCKRLSKTHSHLRIEPDSRSYLLATCNIFLQFISAKKEDVEKSVEKISVEERHLSSARKRYTVKK